MCRSAPRPTSTRRASTSRTRGAPPSSRSTPTARGMRMFASGLRNPNGMDWEPTTGALWTAVNERDKLGDDLVPDYITSVRDGGFYGWPYSYFGQHEDPRQQGKRPDLVARAIVPDFALARTPHRSACCSTAARRSPSATAAARSSAQRGSWNRSSFSGYRVDLRAVQRRHASGPDPGLPHRLHRQCTSVRGLRTTCRPCDAARRFVARRRRWRREDLAGPICRLKPEAAVI